MGHGPAVLVEHPPVKNDAFADGLTRMAAREIEPVQFTPAEAVDRHKIGRICSAQLFGNEYGAVGMNGDLTVESTLGKGSTFILAIPKGT